LFPAKPLILEGNGASANLVAHSDELPNDYKPEGIKSRRISAIGRSETHANSLEAICPVSGDACWYCPNLFEM